MLTTLTYRTRVNTYYTSVSGQGTHLGSCLTGGSFPQSGWSQISQGWNPQPWHFSLMMAGLGRWQCLHSSGSGILSHGVILIEVPLMS